MRTSALLATTALLMLACRSEGQLVFEQPEFSLVVDSPTYGEFMGDAPATVTGWVTPSYAAVTIEGEPVEVGEGGRFEAVVDIDYAYRIIDVEAEAYDVHERVRVPVFRGHDPIDTWPGGLTARITPSGLAVLGEGLGPMIDTLGWDQMIMDALPPIQTGVFDLIPTAVTHDPSVVELIPATDGIDVAASLRKVTIHMDATVRLFDQVWTFPVEIAYARIALGATAVPGVDADGMLSLEMTGGIVDLDDPTITAAGTDVWLLDLLLDGIGMIIEPIGEALLAGVLDQVGAIDLGGPYVFDTELMGTPLQVRLSDAFGDLGGMGLGLGMGIGEPAIVGPLPMPTPTDDREEVHAALGLHEGLLQIVVFESGLLDLLGQDLDLPGGVGDLLGLGIKGIDGGDDPPSGDGWCIGLAPQPAQVVRLQDRIEPLGVIYLPDVVVDIGIKHGETCDPWLTTSLALQVGLFVRAGTKLSVDIGIKEGAVLYYGSDESWDEEQVIDDLAGVLGGVLDLVTGQLSFDLADLMGGGLPGGDPNDPLGSVLGDLDFKIIDSQPLLDADGNHPEGLYNIGLQLWAVDAP